MVNPQEARKWLEAAIRRQERQMNGEEQTTDAGGEISQMLLLEEMTYALDNLKGTFGLTSQQYNDNISKFPDSVENNSEAEDEAN